MNSSGGGSVKASARSDSSGHSERLTSGAATTLTSLRLPPEDKHARGTGGSNRSDNRSTISNSSTGSGDYMDFILLLLALRLPVTFISTAIDYLSYLKLISLIIIYFCPIYSRRICYFAFCNAER
jgi:hypothetical protein